MRRRGHEPDFDGLLDDDLDPAERERLRRVHELLVAAGPPPELPPALLAAAAGAEVVPLQRRRHRRIGAVVILAAALAATAFGAGYLLGDRNAEQAAPESVIAMRGEAGARASLALFARDDAGNWPMELTVRGLAELPEGRTYELWLTKGGKLKEPCGTFVVEGDKTVVPLNAPYRLKEFDGWVVTRTGSETPLLTT